jgi:hypothetical protein
MLQIGLETFWEDLVQQFTVFLPKIAGAVVILIIGWIVGRLLGKGISKVLDKAGVDDVLRKNVFGKALEKSGFSVVGFFDLIIRWFVYLVAILAAANVLNITLLSTYINQVVSYLPNLIAGVFILVVGFIVSDWVVDTVDAITAESEVEFAKIFTTVIRFFLYFVITFIALTQMQIDITILNVIVNALAWGAGIGLGVGLAIAFGWGLKEVVAKKAEEWMDKATETAKKVEKATEKQT